MENARYGQMHQLFMIDSMDVLTDDFAESHKLSASLRMWNFAAESSTRLLLTQIIVGINHPDFRGMWA